MSGSDEQKILNAALLKAAQLDMLKPLVPTVQPDHFLLAQSAPSNALAHNLTSRLADPAQLDLYGNAHMEGKDFKLFIRGYDELTSGINTSAAKLLDSLLITATAEGLGNTLVCLPLREYMRMRGLKDEKETRRQVKRDIDALERVRFEYKGTGRERGSWLNVTLAGGTSGIKNSIIYFRFNEDFYSSLRISENKYLFMYFPKETLNLNDNANPHSYAFARRIAEHKRINLGKHNEDIISVSTLLEASPAFPTYQEVRTSDRAVTRKMIEPFERDMDALHDAFTWEYIGDQPDTYDRFIKTDVRIRWANYPDVKTLKVKRAQTQVKAADPKSRVKNPPND